MEIKVPPEFAQARLDAFLHSRWPDFSRSWIQKLIKQGRATIKGTRALASRKLKAGDVVSFEPQLPPEISLEPEGHLDDKIKIVFENDDFVVIDKPAGVSAHPSATEPKGTIVNWLIWKYPSIKSVGDFDPNRCQLSAVSYLRPGLVHRLDKDTSGLMVIAKNQSTFQQLKKQFQNRLVTKRYLALACGQMPADNGQIDLNIVRSRSDPTKNTTTNSKNRGRAALTYWRVLKHYPDFSLLEVTPKTGRMHQIRVHLKAIGHPVAGDKKYAPAPKNPKHLGRMFLHAAYLSFTSAEGEKFSFHSPLPEELERALQNLPYVVR
ncbi:MAG: RluA family pseudouridine synthase [Patescibacteria group bacterium]